MKRYRPRRIPWGKERGERRLSGFEIGKCHDCGAAPGELHMARCDMEQCPICGNQLLSCGHDELYFGKRHISILTLAVAEDKRKIGIEEGVLGLGRRRVRRAR